MENTIEDRINQYDNGNNTNTIRIGGPIIRLEIMTRDRKMKQQYMRINRNKLKYININSGDYSSE